eukprot:4831161-Prymnesium_polylepis.1
MPAAPVHQPAQHPADDAPTTRTSVATHARVGRRATRTAHGDYLTVISSTRTSCQTRHRRAR